ncbi:DUF1330 domain-containing protein [Bacillus sp. NP157]|nr:DUF1330 domain-containing protein [Bacillus sp. NP157]
MTAYVVFTRLATKDKAEMETYASIAKQAGEGHPITRLAFYGPIETLEGPELEGSVILSFPTADEARAWYNSPLYQEARTHRLKGADYHVFIAEGI